MKYPEADYSLWKFDDLFIYNSETGDIVWKVRPLSHFASEHAMKIANAKFAGKVAGHEQTHYKNGKRKGKRARFFGRLHEVHLLIWRLHYGPVQDGLVVDHIDGDPWNNRLSNLRLATVSQNGQNSSRAPNKVGIRGVTKERHYNKFKATIYADGKRHHLGLFGTPEEAGAAYNQAAERLHGEFRKTSTTNHV